MQEIKYYPLVDMDNGGKEKQPMFPTNDVVTVKENHRMWLSEIVSSYYRLCSRETITAKEVK